MSNHARSLTAAVHDHPRHTILAALAAGLLMGPRWPAALLVAAAAALATPAAAALRRRAPPSRAISHRPTAAPREPLVFEPAAAPREPLVVEPAAPPAAAPPEPLVVEPAAPATSSVSLPPLLAAPNEPLGRRPAAPPTAAPSEPLSEPAAPPVAAPREPLVLEPAAPRVSSVSLPPLLAAAVAVALLAGGVAGRERLRVMDRSSLRPSVAFAVRGFAVEPARTRAFGSRLVPVRLAAGPGAGERVLVRAPARLGLGAVAVGEEVVARGELRALRPFEAFERRRGVHAVLEAAAVRTTGRRRRSLVDAVRRRAEAALDAGARPEQAALARGMVLGQDHALPDDLRDAFRASGLAHLVAASGQNVMLLAALVIAAATAAGALLRTRLVLALVAVALYVPLAGAGPSIQRAGAMGAAGLVAALAGRPASRWYALLLAAAATLTVNPRAAEDPGWQLSFAAVVAILALHRRLRDALVSRGSPRGLAEATALTAAATAGTAPLVALHFEQVSLVSLPANLLAAPAVAPVMWLGALSAALGEPAAEALNALNALPLAYLAWLARAAASVPHATVAAALPGPLAAAAAYAAMALAALAARAALRRRRAGAVRGGRAGRVDGAAAGGAPWRRRRRAGVALVAFVVAVLVVARPGVLGAGAPPRGFAITALDVGQGDATLLQHGSGHAVLVDTGPPGAGVVGKLRAAGVKRLDALLLTHSSRDHEGALREVLDALDVRLVLDGRQTAAERAAEDDGGEGGGTRFAGLSAGVRVGVPEAGQTVRAGPIELRILWPPPGRSRAGDPNLTATVALVRDGGTTALLTADAESPVTLPLDLPHVDVLKVAHHGSADEGLPELLERLQPRAAIIPVGRNTYGHPAPSTLAALRRVPEVRRTDHDGTVRVEPTGGGLSIH
ncbi:MAG TPA: ComEC/Rec2 family competence protein [Solirubrobacteraceae bacterium]|nr:ComEC/Rec2 family competence protein [Solirubrobacteraceae bacterium]